MILLKELLAKLSTSLHYTTTTTTSTTRHHYYCILQVAFMRLQILLLMQRRDGSTAYMLCIASHCSPPERLMQCFYVIIITFEHYYFTFNIVIMNVGCRWEMLCVQTSSFKPRRLCICPALQTKKKQKISLRLPFRLCRSLTFCSISYCISTELLLQV